MTLDFDAGKEKKKRHQAGKFYPVKKKKRTYLFFAEQAENSQFISVTFSSCCCVWFLLLFTPLPSLRSGSGSGNRSVTCHYWSNSVIRHRALAVCSTLYAGTAGVPCTGLEIRFDTRTQARGQGPGLDRTGTKCGCVYMDLCACVCVSKRGKRGKHGRTDWIFVFPRLRVWFQTVQEVSNRKIHIKAPMLCIIHFINVYQQ